MVLGALPEEESKHQLRTEIEYFRSMTNANTNISQPLSSNSPNSVFLESIQSDVNSIQELRQAVNVKSVEEFLDQIDGCDGNVFVSGIGNDVCLKGAFSVNSKHFSVAVIRSEYSILNTQISY